MQGTLPPPLLAPSERHLDAHLKLASGQTPPATPLIHERFREDDPLGEPLGDGRS